VYSLADYAMGGALTSRLRPGERCATLEIKINYLAPVSEGILVAEAQVVERTKGSSHVARGTRRPLIRSIQMKRSAHGLRGSTALW
jgi:uncharacterized protein (TIGR00369 family)